MARALELARAGWGRVHPNPMVGAVVVNGGRVVGEGWHAGFGEPHAEVVALRAAGEAARDATLYVTLEPCAHHGKTPPCTEAIIEAAVARVVYAVADPTVHAAGGATVLTGHGVEVEAGVRRADAIALDPAFHWMHRHSSTWVTLKLAVSLDGRLGRRTGRRSPVSGPQALAETHRLRAGFDAILIGRATVEVDDPLLTVRGDIEPRIPPVRIVFDAAARTPPQARLLATLERAPVWIVTAPGAPADRVRTLASAGARMLEAPAATGRLDIDAAFAMLWREGVRSILCEGGGRLAASMLAAGRVNRLHLFIAPIFFGAAGPPAFPLDAAAEGWTLRASRQVGRDAWLMLDRDAEAT